MSKETLDRATTIVLKKETDDLEFLTNRYVHLQDQMISGDNTVTEKDLNQAVEMLTTDLEKNTEFIPL